MASRRLLLAKGLMFTGVRESWFGRDSALLLIVNYHRLRGDRDGHFSQFDDGVFGPDQSEFLRQMQWLSASTTVLDEVGLLELTRGGRGNRADIYSAITFDDAYSDCYSLAKPVLERVGLRAIFFVPIDMIDSRQLGWWDLAAYLMKNTSKRSIVVGNHVLNLSGNFEASLRRVLNLFKLRPVEETGGLLEELSHACGISLPSRELQSAELMTWEQLRALKSAGHGIGSHTYSHRVLATLTPEQQEREIRSSRSELATRVGADVLSFAYPVGGPQHLNAHSVRFVREAGYEQAFTFNTGIARLPVVDRFQIPRESAHSFDILKAKALMPRVMGLREKRAV